MLHEIPFQVFLYYCINICVVQSQYIFLPVIRFFAYAKGKFFGFYVRYETLADGINASL